MNGSYVLGGCLLMIYLSFSKINYLDPRQVACVSCGIRAFFFFRKKKVVANLLETQNHGRVVQKAQFSDREVVFKIVAY